MKYVGHEKAKEKLRELGLGLKRLFKTKTFPDGMYVFVYASHIEKNAREVAAYKKKGKVWAVRVVKSGNVWEVYERPIKKKPKRR